MTDEEFAASYADLPIEDLIGLALAMKRLTEAAAAFMHLSRKNPGARRFSVPWGMVSLAGIVTHGIEGRDDHYRAMLDDCEKFLNEMKDKYRNTLMREIGEESK